MTRISFHICLGIAAICLALPASAQVSGSGTAKYLPVWIGSTTLGDSVIFQNGKRLGVNAIKPNAALDVRARSNAPALFGLGWSAPGGSDISGSNALVGQGGDADPDSGFATGGAGVQGTGGASSQTVNSAGPGGYFVGGGGGGGDGIDATCSSSCFAGNFQGNVNVSGTLTAATKNFRIDDPVDPTRKYLQHAAVESSEMKNIYDGTIVLDRRGEATVALPAWFQAENGSFRYQLTAIGAPAPGLFIAKTVKDNRFRIAGGKAGVEVSWQVTGVRRDPFAAHNPLVVEQEKTAEERGRYLHPEYYGAAKDKRIGFTDTAPRVAVASSR